MRKTLLLLTTMALALLLAAGMAWADTVRPTVVPPTVPADNATNVNPANDITATFSEAMRARSINTNTFYLLKGNFTAQSATKNPKRFCTTVVTPPTLPTTAPCPTGPIAIPPATVSYAGNTATLNPNSTLALNTTYTVVVEGTGDGDNFAVKDTGGTALLTAGTGDFIFHFTTWSAPPPIIP
jgi:hypothetical protein